MNQIQSRFQRALAFHQAGRLSQAQGLYREILREYPEHFDSCHLLGVLLIQAGMAKEGVALIRAALRIKPGSSEVHYNLAHGLQTLGEYEEALTSLQRAMSLNPREPDYFLEAGNLLKELKRLDEAVAAYGSAIGLQPGYAVAYNNMAIALRDLGRLEEALARYDEAISLRPDYAEAYYNRGNALRDLDRPDAALASYDAAISLRANHPEAHNNRGNALKELGRLDEALAAYDQAISLKPDHAEAFYNRGNALSELDRPGEALASFDKAISLKPDHFEAFNNRGNALRKLERFEEALANYDHAIALNSGHFDACNNRGNVLRELGRFEEALASYDQAIKLKPDHAEAHASRGNVLVELGRLDDALACYRTAISLVPDSGRAWLGMARIDSETGRFDDAEAKYRIARSLAPATTEPLCGIAEIRKFTSDDPLIPEIKALLSNDSLSDDDRARLHHAYAKICNDLGRYDDAMDNFTRGKTLMRSKFRIARHIDGHAAIARIFTREFFAERTGFGIPDERPVFVVGMPRSGTTLAEQILSSHHQVDGLGELQDITNIVRHRCGGLSDLDRFEASVLGLKPAEVNEMAGRYLDTYRRSRKECVRIVDKLPHNYQWLGIIALMFPKAHVVHCRRDPLDNCVSMYMQHFNESHGYNQDLAILGRYYCEYAKLMDHWSAVLPLPVHDLVYENTVSDLEGSARSLVSFLRLEWDPNCLNYHRTDRHVSTPSQWQVRQPLYNQSVGRWLRYERHLGPLRKALGCLP